LTAVQSTRFKFGKMIDINKYSLMHKNLPPKVALCGSSDPFLNLGTNNTMDNSLDDWWSVECCQQISAVEYVDNSKRGLSVELLVQSCLNTEFVGL